jgi:S-adenosylmethionine synthetase
MYLWTSEFVSSGHPDKVADQLADAILDAYLTGNSKSKVACEVTITKDFVLVTGEVNSPASPDIEAIVRTSLVRIGYDGGHAEFDGRTCVIVNKMHVQSHQIHQAVAEGGAGDQGLMFGYATNETHCHMPVAIYLAREIIRELEQDRVNPGSPLLPDAKSQVTLALHDDGSLDHVDTVVVSACHRPHVGLQAIQDYVRDLIVGKMLDRLPEGNLADAFGRAKFILNPAGVWTVGGPAADTGLSGRKLVVDNYGADCPIGGGSFSGKDPTKVDRSGAYAARHLAKNLVAAGLGQRALVQLAYAIGLAEPVSLRVLVNDGGRAIDFGSRVREAVDLTPLAIIERFGLCRPIFLPTAAGGHFGREPHGDFFGWERLDLVDRFRGKQPATANTIMVIRPYWHVGTWVFDDPAVGLVQEPFVTGIPEMIDILVREIPDPRSGFRLLFCAQVFPGWQQRMVWLREEDGGNWYSAPALGMDGWLCPALFKYFTEAPADLFVKAEPLGQ